MALSCNHSAVMSSPCGSFWEPSIPCDLVSPWLRPVLEEIPEASGRAENPGRCHEIIALMCGMRRPRLLALWIGAAISGLVPKVIESVRSGTPPHDPNGFHGQPPRSLSFRFGAIRPQRCFWGQRHKKNRCLETSISPNTRG